MLNKKEVKIFVASSGKLGAERKESVSIIVELNKAFRHLALEPVLYEIDTSSGNNPGYKRIQDRINLLLDDCDIVVIIFYDKVGEFTKEEYDRAIAKDKKVFFYLKEGFSPRSTAELENYTEVITLKEQIEQESAIRYQNYESMTGYKALLYPDLNKHLAEAYNSEVEISAEAEDAIREEKDKVQKDFEEIQQRFYEGVKNAVKDSDEVTDKINRVINLKALVNRKRVEKEELRKKFEDNTENKELLEAYKVAQGDWLNAIEEHEEAEKELNELKGSLIRLKDLFDNIDLKKASERLQDAHSLFEEGLFAEVRELLTSEQREKERAKVLASHEAIEQQRKNLADEDLVHAQSILLDTDDPSRFEEAEKAFKSSVEIYPSYNNHFEYAKYLAKQNEHHKAIKQYQYTLSYTGNDEDKKATSLNNLGVLYSDNNDSSAAAAAYEECLAIYRKLAEQNPAAYEPDVAMTLNNLGVLYSDNNDSSAAAAAYEECLAIRRKLAEQNPAAYEPDVAMTLNNLGVLYSDNNDSSAAAAAYEECLAIRRKLAEQTPTAYEPNVANTLNNLGILYRHNNDSSAAAAAYEECLAIYRKLAEQNPAAYEPDVAMTLNNLGVLYSDNNDSSAAAAAAAYEECLAIYRNLAEQNPAAYEPYVASTLNNLGILYSDNNDSSAAAAAYEECLAIRRKLAEQNPAAYEPNVAMTSVMYAVLLNTKGTTKEAKSLLEEALAIFEKFTIKNPDRYQWFVDDVKQKLQNL